MKVGSVLSLKQAMGMMMPYCMRWRTIAAVFCSFLALRTAALGESISLAYDRTGNLVTTQISAAAAAPMITSGPFSQLGSTNDTAAFSVNVASVSPVTYQWMFNGSAITGATSDSYVIDQALAGSVGLYTVVVTNAQGSVTSDPYHLFFGSTLGRAVNQPSLIWQSGGGGSWEPQTTVTHDGSEAVKSGALSGPGSTWLETSMMNVPAYTRLRFWWKISAAEGCALRLIVNGKNVRTLTGEQDWQQAEVTLPVDTVIQSLRWQFDKTSAGAGTADKAWVDQIETDTLLPGIGVQDSQGTQLNDGGSTVDIGFAAVSINSVFYDFSGTLADQFEVHSVLPEAVVTQSGGTLNYHTLTTTAPVAETTGVYRHKTFQPSFNQSWMIEVNAHLPQSLAAGLPLSPVTEGWYAEAELGVMFDRSDGSQFTLASFMGVESDEGRPIARRYENDYNEVLPNGTQIGRNLPFGPRPTTDETVVLRFSFNASTKLLTAESGTETLAALDLSGGKEWGMGNGDHFRMLTGFGSGGWAIPQANPISVDSFRAVLTSPSSPKTFTITNTGQGLLSDLRVTKDGVNATDFTLGVLEMTELAPGESTTFTVTFIPSGTGARSASLHIASNAAGSANPFDLLLTGTGLTAAESWRQQHFGSTANSGNAAETFDYDKDGLANLLEWACNLNPTTASALPASANRNGASLEFTYTRSISALNAGAVFTVEWSDTLANDWQTTGVSESILSDNGTVQQVSATLPSGSGGRRFVHLKVTAP